MKNIYDIDNISRVREIENNRDLRFIQKARGLSVIVLILNNSENIILLLKCLEEAENSFVQKEIPFEIIIGDTGTTDKKVLEFYSNLKENYKVINDLSYHFSKNNNLLAFKHAKYDTLLFLNNDILLQTPNDLLQIYESLHSDPNIGIAGSVLLFENKKIQHAGIAFADHEETQGFFPYHIHENESIDSLKDSEKVMSFPAVIGAFLFIKWELFLTCLGFDEYYEKEGQDIDLCLKVKRLGYKIILTNFGTIFHYENGAKKKGEESNSDRMRLIRKWSNFIKYGLQL